MQILKWLFGWFGGGTLTAEVHYVAPVVRRSWNRS